MILKLGEKIKILGVEFEAVPEVENMSCKGCFFANNGDKGCPEGKGFECRYSEKIVLRPYEPKPEVKKNIVTKIVAGGTNSECHINDKWAFSVFKEELSNNINPTNHGSQIYLRDGWYDDSGTKIHGHLFFDPPRT